MINKIILAVDGSENASRATDTAAELASKLDADLCILHVLMHGRPAAELVRMAEVEHLVEDAGVMPTSVADYSPRTYLESLRSETEGASTAKVISSLGEQIVSRAEARCRELGARVASKSMRSGDYAEEIIDAAKEFSADMIVVGTRGLGTVRSTILGSVSQKVLHHAPCNVLTVI